MCIRTTGFFLVWLMEAKDSDFLRNFNRSTLHVKSWSFQGAIGYCLGIDRLWDVYMIVMGGR